MAQRKGFYDIPGQNGGLSKLTTAILYLSWAAISDSVGIGYTLVNRTICFLSKSAYKIIF